MPMTVPNCAEWSRQPGFKTGPCFCVRVCETPVDDCASCGGSGLLGTVPQGVWEVARRGAMPEYRGDERFDPRARMARIWRENQEMIAARDAKDRADRRLTFWLLTAFIVVPGVALLVCKACGLF